MKCFHKLKIKILKNIAGFDKRYYILYTTTELIKKEFLSIKI